MSTKLAWAFLGLAAAALAASPQSPKPPDPKAAKNLLRNSDFEEGTVTPVGWQTVDGLTTYWTKDSDAAHGKVIRFDTDVLQLEAYDWWVKIARGAAPADAPKKTPSKDPNKYDTIAAYDGVFMWSDPIPVEKGKSYWLTLDVKGPEIMTWLVGYPEKPDLAYGADMAAFQDYLKDKIAGKPRPKGRNFDPFIHTYVWKGQLKAGGPNEWRTYSRREKPFRPTSATPSVRFARVLLLPYWPPAEYAVDNVRLVEFEEKD